MSSIRLIKAEQPITRSGISSSDVISYDSDNIYPQRIWWLLAASTTGISAAQAMADNIECDGFANSQIGIHENMNGDSLNDILTKISFDIARFGGYYLNIQYNALGEAVNVYHIPFEQVRIKMNSDYKEDSRVREYKVFNNWEKSSDLSTDISKAVDYKAYNPDNVLSEIEAVGGIENYSGQILCVSKRKFKGYPLSPFHTVQSQLDAEALNATYVRRQLSNGFKDCSIVEFEEIQNSSDESGTDVNDEFMGTLAAMQGANAASSFLAIKRPIMNEQSSVRVTPLNTAVDKDYYRALLEPLQKSICMAANNLPIPLIDMTSVTGSLNTSGNIITECRKMYRESLLSYRNMISSSLAKIFGVSEDMFLIDDKLNQVNANVNNNG